MDDVNDKSRGRKRKWNEEIEKGTRKISHHKGGYTLEDNQTVFLILPCKSEFLFFVKEETMHRTVSFRPVRYVRTGAAIKFSTRSDESSTRRARIIETYISRIWVVDAPVWRSLFRIAALNTFPVIVIFITNEFNDKKTDRGARIKNFLSKCWTHRKRRVRCE